MFRIPSFGLIARLPTWLSPFGGSRTKEIREAENSFKVEFEMTHTIFGRTRAYNGSAATSRSLPRAEPGDDIGRQRWHAVHSRHGEGHHDCPDGLPDGFRAERYKGTKR